MGRILLGIKSSEPAKCHKIWSDALMGVACDERRPSTSEALREIEAAMRGIEAAHSPKASAAAAVQLRTYDNSFWEPEAQPGQVLNSQHIPDLKSLS